MSGDTLASSLRTLSQGPLGSNLFGLYELTGSGRSEEIHGHITTLQTDQLQHLVCDVYVGDVTEGCCLSFLLIF